MKNPLIKLISLLIVLTVLAMTIITLTLTPKVNLVEEQRKEEALQEYLLERYIKRNQDKKLYLTGHFDPVFRNDFAVVPDKYNIGGYKMYLRKETLTAFIKMAEKAKEDGVSLKIISATRNFVYQKSLWDKKWTGYTLVEGRDLSKSIPDGLERFKKILEYSAAPTTSRHHWGTDIDINNANVEYFSTASGIKVYDWLSSNARDFGFCQPYNIKNEYRPTGYNEERWYWSYSPLARDFTKEYLKLVKNEDIKDFQGEEFVKDQNLIQEYVLGINPECL